MQKKWTEQELIDFITEASQQTYASKEGKKLAAPHRPGCDEYLYEKGNWKYLDSYAWIKDGGGEEIVYYKDKPVWVLNYYGFLTGTEDTKSIYGFLREALNKEHPELPIRGDSLTDDARGLRYEIEFLRKDIGNFHGIERIYQNEKQVYGCYIHGGFVV